MRKLRTLLTTYREAGGRNGVLLLHDDQHGTELIDALARHGDGLPANAIPLAVNEITQVGLEAIAAAFANGTFSRTAKYTTMIVAIGTQSSAMNFTCVLRYVLQVS